MLTDIVTAVRTAGLRLAIHLEPYKGRSLATVAADLAYLPGARDHRGVPVPGRHLGPAADWAAVTAAKPDMRFFAESGNLGSMLSGAFADYARDRRLRRDLHLRRRPLRRGRDGVACGAARQRRLLCSPSVGAGLRRPAGRHGQAGRRRPRRRAPLRHDCGVAPSPPAPTWSASPAGTSGTRAPRSSRPSPTASPPTGSAPRATKASTAAPAPPPRPPTWTARPSGPLRTSTRCAQAELRKLASGFLRSNRAGERPRPSARGARSGRSEDRSVS